MSAHTHSAGSSISWQLPVTTGTFSFGTSVTIPMNGTLAMNSVSSTAEHAVSRAAGCGCESRTECQPEIELKPVALVHCQCCKKLFASSKEWIVRPGDFIDQFRAEGSAPIVECDACAAKPYEAKYSKTSAETIEILRSLREERDAARPPRQLLHDPPAAKRNVESEKRARRHWAKWRVPLAQAFKERKEMTARQIAEVMGITNGTSREAHAAIWRARNAGFDIVVVNTVKLSHGYATSWYGLKNGESILPPQDPETKQFMREVARPPSWLNALIEALSKQPMTIGEINALTGLAPCTKMRHYARAVKVVVVGKRATPRGKPWTLWGLAGANYAEAASA